MVLKCFESNCPNAKRANLRKKIGPPAAVRAARGPNPPIHCGIRAPRAFPLDRPLVHLGHHVLKLPDELLPGILRALDVGLLQPLEARLFHP